MNKRAIVDYIFQETNGAVSRKDIESVMKAFTDAIKLGVKDSGLVRLIGFGTFHKREQKARTARHPQTGAEIHVPAKNVVKFTAGTEFKEELEG